MGKPIKATPLPSLPRNLTMIKIIKGRQVVVEDPIAVAEFNRKLREFKVQKVKERRRNE